jgi:hypothetical protein
VISPLNGGNSNVGIKTCTQSSAQRWVLEPSVTLSTQLVGQQRSLLCWVAAVQMAVRTNYSFASGQPTALAVYQKVKPNMTLDSNQPAYPAQIRNACNDIVGSTNYAYNYYAFKTNPISEGALAVKIHNGYPVIQHREWDANNAHALVIYGYYLNGAELMFKIHDPDNGSGVYPSTGESYSAYYATLVSGTLPHNPYGTWGYYICR